MNVWCFIIVKHENILKVGMFNYIEIVAWHTALSSMIGSSFINTISLFCFALGHKSIRGIFNAVASVISFKLNLSDLLAVYCMNLQCAVMGNSCSSTIRRELGVQRMYVYKIPE